MPSRTATTTSSRSSIDPIKPSPRIRSCSRPALEVGAAGHRVVLLDRLEDVGQRDAVGHELLRNDLDLELLGQPAPGVDLDDTGHLAQAEGDLPVEEAP